MITPSSTLVDVAFAVCTALDEAGVTAVLTGGSAATYHAPAANQSDDLDFVITLHSPEAAGEQALSRIGYARLADYYVHPASPFPLEFPPGPLMIGEDVVTRWHTERRGREVLHVLTATDSCRDRLAAFLFWNDFGGLDQALAVCRACRDQVDTARVRAWVRREGGDEKAALFERRLAEHGLLG